MGTTSKLALYKAELDDSIIVEQQIGEPFTIIDRYIGFYQCTSVTRPSPYEGLKIYETDTQLLYIYALGVWTLFVDTPPVSSSGGRKAFTKVTTNTTGISNSEATAGLSTTFTSELNRRYWVEITLVVTSASYTNSRWFTRWAAGGSVTTSGTSLSSTRYFNIAPINATDGDPDAHAYIIYEFVPNVAGSVTVGLFALSGAGGETVDRRGSGVYGASKILVRDVGSSI